MELGRFFYTLLYIITDSAYTFRKSRQALVPPNP